jgi:hypothetical protein
MFTQRIFQVIFEIRLGKVLLNIRLDICPDGSACDVQFGARWDLRSFLICHPRLKLIFEQLASIHHGPQHYEMGLTEAVFHLLKQQQPSV